MWKTQKSYIWSCMILKRFLNTIIFLRKFLYFLIYMFKQWRSCISIKILVVLCKYQVYKIKYLKEYFFKLSPCINFFGSLNSPIFPGINEVPLLIFLQNVRKNFSSSTLLENIYNFSRNGEREREKEGRKEGGGGAGYLRVKMSVSQIRNIYAK